MWRSVIFLLTFVCALLATPGRLNGKNVETPEVAQQEQASEFPNTTEGFQSFVDEILRAIKAKDSAREAALLDSLLMPEDSTWWVEEYGLGFGTRLKAAYERQRRALEQEIRTVYEGNAKRGWASPKMLRYSDPEAVNAPLDRFLNCMNQIVPLYQTTFPGSDVVMLLDLRTGKRVEPNTGNLDGYYVYDRGGFRFVPLEILMKLPNERPIRIQLDMAVMESKLIEKFPIRVPPEAIKKHIGGRATVEVALGLKGETQNIKPVDGDPILTGAVIEAVKQWRFGPTTLDGDPVEVSVRVSVTFDIR